MADPSVDDLLARADKWLDPDSGYRQTKHRTVDLVTDLAAALRAQTAETGCEWREESADGPWCRLSAGPLPLETDRLRTQLAQLKTDVEAAGDGDTAYWYERYEQMVREAADWKRWCEEREAALAEARAAAPQPLWRGVLHQTHGIRPLLAVTLDVPPGTEVAVYRADQTPLGITAEDVERAKFLAECADTPLMRDVMAERDAIAAAARGLLTSCRECRDERDFYTDPVKPADFIIWGKLAPPEGLGPKCYDHAVKHLGHDMPRRSDQYAVVDLRPIRAALDALEGTDG